MGLIWSFDFDPPQPTIRGEFTGLNSWEKPIDLNSCKRVTLNKPEDLENQINILMNDLTLTSLDKINKIINIIEHLTEQSGVSEELRAKHGKIIEKLNSIKDIYYDIK